MLITSEVELDIYMPITSGIILLNLPELNEFDYLMRIDDDSWFKKN